MRDIMVGTTCSQVTLWVPISSSASSASNFGCTTR
ncbi:Uncharacterised protein [Mycobacteroides abscessus subsp. abscessus]|nr:Uncharacterised protein [Mycobacteroides abscessus subsp. abscessus]